MVHKAAQQIQYYRTNSTQSQLIYKNDKQTCKSNGFFLLLNVNDYQHSSLQVVGDHSAIIMGPIYLCNFL